MNSPILEIDQLDVTLKNTPILKNVCFKFQAQSITGLLGPNGAGKTTLIRSILGLIEPSSGEIRFMGNPITLPNLRQVGYLSEERSLDPNMTLINQLIYLGELKGMTRVKASEEAQSYLERYGLADKLKHKCSTLSKGMMQKALLAASLISDPKLLILDEPFAGLDPLFKKELIKTIMEKKKQGTAIILSTHQMHEVESLCDTIFFINKGQTLYSGGLSELKERYLTNTLKIFYKSPASVDFLKDCEGVQRLTAHDDWIQIDILSSQYRKKIIALCNENLEVNQIEVLRPTLDEIYVDLIKDHG
jgi:ABC-2 type transport system ATP-binding protein